MNDVWADEQILQVSSLLQFNKLFFSSVQSLSHVRLCNLMDCSTPGFPVYQQLPELAQTHVHRGSDAIQPSHPQLSPSPAFNLSQHLGLFQWVRSLHQVAKYRSFGFSISPSNEYSGLISFRWLKLEEINTSFEGWTFSWRCFTRLETF